MPIYKYKARDKFGKLVTGTIGGDNKDAVASHFESMGYVPVSIEEEGLAQQISFLSRAKRVKLDDLNLFNRQLITLIKSGVPLLAGLNALVKQTKSPALKYAIQVMIKDIEGGSSFSDALRNHPQIFDELYVNTVKAGETSGQLDEILTRLTDLGEHELDMKTKIKAATRYPIITMSVLTIGFFILVTYVIPQFASLFDRYKGVLPLPTRMLIWLNRAIKDYWYITIILVAILIFAFKRFVSTKQGKRLLDNFKLKIPVIGPLIFIITMSRFSRITAIMIRSGVPILGALDMVSRTIGNIVIGDAIRDIKNSIHQGKGMAEPMRISKVFSPMVVQMVAIGEETGKVDELLFRVSEYYDQQADYMIKNLTTMIEPILVVILGCVVLLLALAIFLPVWNMMGLFRGGG